MVRAPLPKQEHAYRFLRAGGGPLDMPPDVCHVLRGMNRRGSYISFWSRVPGTLGRVFIGSLVPGILPAPHRCTYFGKGTEESSF